MNIPLNDLEIMGLNTLDAQIVAAQQAMDKALRALCESRGLPIPKRFKLGDDGRSIDTIDETPDVVP